MECPRCHSPALSEARFCSACGAELAAEQRTPSREAGDRVRNRDLRAGGETRLLTALFADLSGSVAATHGLDPESAAERVNEVLDVMARAITRYEGHIDRYLGDGVLAFFGAPQAHEDDPLRAILAALEIRDELEHRGFRATSGINTGEVYLGRIGSDRHAEFSALGPVINLAARLQSRAEPGQVLVGENTYREARRSFEFQPLSVQVKGVPQPIVAHLALKPLPRPEKARGLEGLRADLVGRDDDLARLLEALGAVRSGSGRVIAVVGEAGIGKSRLVAELKRHVDRGLADPAADSPILWLDGRCLETTTGTSYGPFVDLFRAFFGGDETGDTLTDRVAATVHDLVASDRLSPDRESDLTALLTNLLSHAEGAGSLFPGASPEQIRNQTFLAIRDFLVALAGRQPVVLFLDDLHWSDALSLDLTALLMSASERAPLLLLCAYRPEHHHPTRDMETTGARQAPGRFTSIHLRPLTETDSDRLLESLFRLPDFPDRLRRSLLERAQGNPLFLEEMLRALVDEGHLVRRNGGWRIRPGIEAVDVPMTVQSIILSRVDRLDGNPRQVLHTAAVIGRLFARPLLAAVVADVSDGRIGVENALAALEEHDLVYLDRVAPEEEYSFKHVFTRDTVYGSLLRRQRVSLHKMVAEAIESLYPERLEDHLEQLARHYDEADVGEKAFDYLMLAAEKSRRAFLNTAAIGYWQRALECLGALDLPDEREPWRRATRGRIQEALGDLYELTGRHEEAIAGFKAALEDAGPANEVDRARILRKSGASLQIQRRPAESMKAFERALDVLGPPGHANEQTWWHERIEIVLGAMMLLYFTGSPDELSGALDCHREEIEAHGSAIQRGAVHRIQALVGLRRERYLASQETIEHARRSVEAIEGSGVLQEIGFARFNHAFANLWADRLDQAEPIMLSALAVGERIGDVILQSRCLAYLSLIRRKRGDVEGTRHYAGRTLEVAETGEMKEYLAAGHAHRAWTAGRTGDWEDTEREGTKGLTLWQELGGPYRLLAWMPAWPLLGAAVARERWDEAARLARFLLDPERQPMPEPLAGALDRAAAAAERGDRAAGESFAEVTALARPPGYM